MSTAEIDRLRDKIDDYKDTIFAISAFINLYRYDDHTQEMRDNVTVFQGRKLTPPSGSPVTPDIGIAYHREAESVLGEVKKSFPQNQSLWIDDFKQLMAYDENLQGWPTASGTVSNHDVVLLLHQSRAALVRKYYQARQGKDITFTRRFAIVEFNRSNERKAYFFLRTVDGNLSCTDVGDRLDNGVQVPLSALLSEYSEVKLYDAEPPLPHLMELIWANIVTLRASEDENFGRLNKNQKLDVEASVDEITEELHKGYSFHNVCGQSTENHPQIPKKDWVMRACKKFIEAGDAEWIAPSEGKIRFLFRRYEDVLRHVIEICAGTLAEDKQLPLFPDQEEVPA
jgi:hypothetical protein